MNWVFTESVEAATGAATFSPLQQPYYLYDSSSASHTYTPPSPPSDSTGFNLNSKVSPSILLIIIILAIIFFVSGLLHLLVRFLTRPPTRNPEDPDNVTAFQGQLQQLFHLHDAGVDQAFIDTLPIFNYKAIIGLKNPFDCAVCLCEFEGDDKLRLLPQCSHAFHMECIDTWLLSHSTCPLCRASLLPEYAPSSCSPFVFVLESGSESSRELVAADRDQASLSTPNSICRNNSQLDFCSNRERGSTRFESAGGEKVVAVKLGKFQNVDQDGGSSSSGAHDSNADARRCFSMGSFAYVMDEGTSLQVPIRMTRARKQFAKKQPLVPGHRPAMSESGCDSRREFTAFDLSKISEIGNINGNAVGRSRRESFSVSKIWMRGKKDERNPSEGSSRRAFSFRFPTRRASNADAEAGNDPKEKNGGGRTISEMGISRCGGSSIGSEFGHYDEESQRCASLEDEVKTPSLARRTLNWIFGRPKKVVHSSFTAQTSPN
uniref:RING-type E3 ubiquitin transferase n=1 Tax=Kalanchoe fedtschenkoi TaxID=63787 RepID=A0A7N0ZUK7_KALFE